MPPKEGASESVPKEFRCALTGKALYMPVVTTDGVAYSYLAMYDLFNKSEGQPRCRETQNPIDFFPAVCEPLHHFMWDQYRSVMRTRKPEDEAWLWEKYRVGMPDIPTAPEEEGDEGFLEEYQCAVDGELAYEPCCLSSGTIVSAHNVPDNGFKKDPNRLIACALHMQKPRPSATLEAMIKEKFPKEYTQRANELAKDGIETGQPTEFKAIEFDPSQPVHLGLGCDGCGIWPIRGKAYQDVQCPEKVGFHLCEPCFKFGYHRRVITGRFHQTHMPKHVMEEVKESDWGML